MPLKLMFIMCICGCIAGMLSGITLRLFGITHPGIHFVNSIIAGGITGYGVAKYRKR